MEQIKREKIVAIFRGVPTDRIAKTARALAEGGIRCMEIALDQTDADAVRKVIDSIRLLKETFGEKILLGAGTVLTDGQVEEAARAGASFILSPNFNEKVVRRTREVGCISVPGALTPSEAVDAYRTGADIIKIFPAGVLGSGYIKAVRGPLGHIPMMAVGGVNLQNVREFLQAGAGSVGVGGSLVSLDAVRSGNFKELTKTAKEYADRVAEYRREG